MKGLYRGIFPAMLGAMPSSALYFGTYECVKRRLSSLATPQTSGRPDASLRPFMHLLAASSGNAMSSMLFVPKEFVKQQLQGQGQAESRTAWGVIRGTVGSKVGGGLLHATALFFLTAARLTAAYILFRVLLGSTPATVPRS